MKPYKEWLSEDYLIFHIQEITGSPSVTDLIHQHGARIAQVVRGDTGQLAESECNEVLQSRISYYANDLTVVGWNAAFLYDSTAGAETAIQLLEYANSQLLEFRHYDDLLTEELERVYTLLDEGTGFFAQWRLARSATRLHTVLLDVAELTEHADNAIKFLSDMFSARLYKLAALKVGVPDYKDLVTRKLRTAEELYRFHGGPVQPEPRLLPGADRCHHSGDRAGVPLPRQTILEKLRQDKLYRRFAARRKNTCHDRRRGDKSVAVEPPRRIHSSRIVPRDNIPYCEGEPCPA